MKLIVECEAEEFTALERSSQPVTQPVEAVVIRQGLLEEERRVAYLDRVSPHVALIEGITTQEPVLRVWLKPKEEADDGDG